VKAITQKILESKPEDISKTINKLIVDNRDDLILACKKVSLRNIIMIQHN